MGFEPKVRQHVQGETENAVAEIEKDKNEEDAEVLAEDDFPEWQHEEEHQPLTAAEVQQVEVANQKWKEFLREPFQGEVKSITWGVPNCSQARKEVVEATARIYGRFRALQVPTFRVHCDRAREFTSVEFRHWVQHRDMMITHSARDEPQGNFRIEREIGWMKSGARLLLKTSRAPVTFWPLAARQPVEELCRSQLDAMEVPTPPLLPFGAVGVARKKTWFNRSQPWK